MTLTKLQKKEQLTQIETAFTDVPLIILSNFEGLTMNHLNKLRSDLQKINATFKVFKNRLAQQILTKQSIVNLETKIKGPTGFIYGGEPCEMSKIIVKFIKQYNILSIKGGVFEKKQVAQDIINHLAKLPPKNILIEQFIRFTKMPIINLVMLLSNPTNKLIITLKAIQEKKS